MANKRQSESTLTNAMIHTVAKWSAVGSGIGPIASLLGWNFDHIYGTNRSKVSNYILST